MSLELIIGCMFSGKTSEIIKLVNRLSVIEKKVLLINSKLDERYDTNKICSHNNNKLDCICVNKLNEISIDKYNECEYIIVDEGQFFEDLFDFVNKSINIDNKHVIVVGLNGDSNRLNFGDINLLYPQADKINLLTAMCIMCKNGTPGIFSKKITNNLNQTDIGSTDKYIPVCRKCYNK